LLVVSVCVCLADVSGLCVVCNDYGLRPVLPRRASRKGAEYDWCMWRTQVTVAAVITVLTRATGVTVAQLLAYNRAVTVVTWCHGHASRKETPARLCVALCFVLGMRGPTGSPRKWLKDREQFSGQAHLFIHDQH
jgi:hypothetical protein